MKNQTFNFKFPRYLILVCFVVSFLSVRCANAAKLSFEVPTSELSVGDEIPVKLFLDTEGQRINAIDLGIVYPALLQMQSISKSGSEIQLWVSEPSYTKDAIFFAGGTPGGLADSHLLIGTVRVRAGAVGEGAFGITPSSRVLLNDGEGTATSLSANSPLFKILSRPAHNSPEVVPTPNKQEVIDSKKPESFKPIIGTDPTVFHDEKFVSFFTNDTGSGIDHYEIKEGDQGFKVARSPYLLSDQNLRTVIKLRAYDTAGNYQETTYPNIFIRAWWQILKLFGK